MANYMPMQHPNTLLMPAVGPSIAAWALRSWPPLWWHAERCNGIQLQHHQTTVTSIEDSRHRCAGHTVWYMQAKEGDAGMAWDWMLMPRGMVAMVDPMCFVTNLRLVGAEGEVLTTFQSARVFNELVYTLPWQREVQRALGERVH
jgi:hypothetical protein